MWHFHCSHGVGDTYLVAALARAFEARVGEMTMNVKPEHEHIAQMFMVRAKASRVLMEAPGEHAWRPGIPINMHPSHLARGDAFDALTGREGFSQADMYRLLMRLPLDAPLSKPLLLSDWKRQAKDWAAQNKIPAGISVVVMPHARSMPAAPFEFWIRLACVLAESGKAVVFNSREPWPPHLPADVTKSLGEAIASGRLVRAFPSLGVLYALIEHAGWVIGPNTGGFVAAVAAELAANKTLVAYDAGDGKPWKFNEVVTLKGAFPFSHQRKFCGRDFQVDEYLLDRRQSHYALASQIVDSGFAKNPIKAATSPMITLRAPMSVGAVVDRITILRLKIVVAPTPPLRRELAEMEGVLREAGIDLAVMPLFGLVQDLMKVNGNGFDIGREMYDEYLDQDPHAEGKSTGIGMALHLAMMRSNRERVMLIQAINAAAGSLLDEVKTYKLA